MNTSTPEPSALTLKGNMSKRNRQAVALQRLPPSTAIPVTREVDALMAFLPESAKAETGREHPPANVDTRDWLKANVTITQNESGGAPVVSFGDVPQGLTGVERVLYPELGVSCARGALFLYTWLVRRWYMKAADACGVQPHEITMFREASPTFGFLFEAVQSAVRTSKLVRTEDTIHALANGEIRKVKTVRTPDGAETVTDEGAIYDTRAAQLELAALDPARYGGKGAGASGVAVSIVLQCPPCDAPPAVDVSASPTQAPEDVDYVLA